MSTESKATSIDSYLQDFMATSGGGKKRLGPSFAEMLTRKLPPTDKDLSRVSIDEITEGLRTLRAREKPWTCTSGVDRHARITLLVRHLVVVRKQRLTAFLYECMMDNMSDPQGSGITAINLIRDMAQQGIAPTHEFYNLALEVLMVHPNYAALLEVLELMKARNMPPQKQTVAVALLRDEQYELAYDSLLKMHAEKTRVDPWVYDVFIFVFGKTGFLDEMLEILASRLELEYAEGLDTLQLYALDVCSAAFHYPGTVSGWSTLVRSGKVNPSDGVVENVLDTAAREADTAMATEALDMLANRVKIRDYHYESLVEAFTNAGDLAGAVRVYCIMHETGIFVTQEVANRLIQSAGERGAGLASWLLEAGQEGKTLPSALVDAVMVNQIAASNYDQAMKLFADYEKLCGNKCPDDVTLQLIRQCRDISAIQELCDGYLDAAKDSDGNESLMEDFNATVEKLFADGSMPQGQACFDKLTEKGLDTSGIQRPHVWKLIS